METAIILLSAYSFVITAVWIVDKQYHKTYKIQYFKYRQFHQEFISLYIETAKQNRKLVDQVHKLKRGIQHSIFYPQNFDFDQIFRWYSTFDIIQGYPEEGISAETTVENLTSENNEKSVIYDERLDG